MFGACPYVPIRSERNRAYCMLRSCFILSHAAWVDPSVVRNCRGRSAPGTAFRSFAAVASHCRGPILPEEIYYHSFLNRDRVVHVVDPDLTTCEALSVLFRLEGFQTAFSINLPGFLASLERRAPMWSSPISTLATSMTGSRCCAASRRCAWERPSSWSRTGRRSTPRFLP